MQICKTVTLRTKKLRNGMLSYYLDYYPGLRDNITMKIVRHEFIGIYIYSEPSTKEEVLYNKEMAKKAEVIRCRRYEDVVSQRLGILDERRLKGDFLAYYREVLKNKNKKWEFVYQHFEKFTNGRCRFIDVDLELCKKFHDYLLNAKGLKTGTPLARNSVAGYWSTFRGFLNVAYRDRLIKENVNDYLDRINTVATRRESLTVQEIKKLYETPCEYDVLRRASIFSCLTGLRRSDIIALTWNNVKEYTDGGHYLDFISVKTQADNLVPISEEAYMLLGEKKDGVIFEGFKREMTNHPLKDWISSAGIKKHITFHCFRHTYASLQIEMGTDAFTVQKLLAHKTIGTTEIYTRHADPKRREAADKICLGLLNLKIKTKVVEKKKGGRPRKQKPNN